MKLVKKIALISMSVVLGLLLITAVTVHIFEDDIKDYALNQIGQQLSTDIKVNEVTLTLWNQFPSASLQFSNVLIKETFKAGDTLIFAEDVFLNFSVTNIISGVYEVNEIAIDQAKINLKRTAEGEDNYHFWKDSEGESAEFKIDLSKVILSNALINFDDKYSGLDLSVTAIASNISGSVTQQILDLSGDINTHVHKLNVSGQSYVFDKTLAGNAGLTIDLAEDIYTFSPSLIAINDLPLSISGSVDLNNDATLLNLKAQSEQADLSAVIRNLPQFVKENLSSFSSQGDFNTSIQITGPVKSGVMPKIQATYALQSGKLTNKSSGVTLHDINTSGTYTAENNKEDLLVINSLDCFLGSGKLSGSGKISRLTNPYLNTSVNGNFDLKELAQFFEFSEIEELAGNAQVSLNYKGNFGKNWEPSAKSIRHAAVSGTINVQDGVVLMKNTPHRITDISGNASLQANDAHIEQLHAQLDESDFNFKGAFKNLMPYLLIEDEKLKITASLTSDYLDFNTILSSSDSNEEAYLLNFPDHFEFDLNTTIATLNFREFTAQHVQAHTILNNRILKISPVQLNTSQGVFVSEISAEQLANGDFKISSKGDITQVNITELFLSLENFHQNFITDKHLKGTTSSDYVFSAVMSNTLDIDMGSVAVTAHIKLKDGELIRHESLAEMAAYMKDKKLISALTDMNKLSTKLTHVKFSELSNTIIIKDSKVTIPKMEIQSDALDIYAQGTHTFNNQIDYSIGFDLADLTARKEYSEDEKGLTKNIFVSMTGTTSNPEFGYDQLAVKDQRKENRAEEKEKIKNLLKSEFSKKDPVSASKAPEQGSVSVTWDDAKTPEKPKTKIIIDKPAEQSSPKYTVEPSSDNDEDDDF